MFKAFSNFLKDFLVNFVAILGFKSWADIFVPEESVDDGLQNLRVFNLIGVDAGDDFQKSNLGWLGEIGNPLAVFLLGDVVEHVLLEVGVVYHESGKFSELDCVKLFA